MGKKSRKRKERERGRPPVAEQSKRYTPWLFLIVAAVAFFAYAHTITYDFVYDDDIQVLRNPWIRDWSKAVQFFTTDVWAFANTDKVSNYYRPLHMLMHTLGYSISGLKPYGYHLINLLIHCICTILVAAVGFRLTRDRFVSTAAGLIFALHPAHVESVVWIAGVTDPLCAAFYFGALYSYIKESDRSKIRTQWIITALLLLGALLSKEMAFTFPIIALWLDWCLLKKLRWTSYAVFAGTFGVYALMRSAALGFFVQNVTMKLSFYHRTLSSVVLLAEYTAKMFVPFDLNAFHVFQPTTTPLDLRFGLSLVVLALFAAAAWWLRADAKIRFLFGFCILTLLPLMNITGIGENVFADRYLYIPSLGSSLLIPLIGQKLWMLRPVAVKWPGVKAALVALTLLLAAFAWMLLNTTFMWRNNPTLFTETIRRSPGATLIVNNLARHYYYRAEYDKAEALFLKASEIWSRAFVKNPKLLAAAHAGLGGIYFQRNQLDLARQYFEKAYEIAPRDFSVLQNMGSIYVGLQDYGKALGFYKAALEINPRNEVTYNNLAAIYLTAKDYDRAIAEAKKALEIFPGYGDAYMNLGRAYAAKGMKEEARRAYLSAGEVDPTKAAAVQEDLKALETPAQPK